MKLFLAFSLLVVTFTLQAAGFSGGDQFTSVALEGNLSVQCSGTSGPYFGSTTCHSETLTPSEYTYFVGPKIDADFISLQATYEDGSTSKIKTERYNSSEGKSRKPFNLWIRTLFQRPLLSYGINSIKYTLTKEGQKVEEGTFTVEVKRGGTNYCQKNGFYFSQSSQDCTFPQNFCTRYFIENNLCQ